jgi:hypothetical protein
MRPAKPLPLVTAQYWRVVFPSRDHRERLAGSWQIHDVRSLEISALQTRVSVPRLAIFEKELIRNYAKREEGKNHRRRPQVARQCKASHRMGRWTGRPVRVTMVEVRRAPVVDVRSLRQSLGLRQTQFAARFGFTAGTARNWEQGRTKPEGAARVLLAVIAHHPEAVEGALRKAS